MKQIRQLAQCGEVPILKAVRVSKRFGSVIALSDLNFEICSGEVVGLVGDNGAGKSTFIKILSGVHKPNSGQIFLEGKEVFFESPKDSIRAGIETVYQDLALAPDLDVFSNVYLGREAVKNGFWGTLGFVDRKKMRVFVREELKRLNVPIDSIDQQVGTLSGGQRQAVAIARAVAWGSKILIMDEPTAALGVEEAEKALELISDIRSKGIAVILVSHTLPHVMSVCDRIVVLMLGKAVANLKIEDTSVDEVVQYITGSKTFRIRS